MTERSPSLTALSVAALRATHQIADSDPKILDDPIAGRLLDDPVLAAIRSGAAGADAPEVRALRSRVVLRSRYAEDLLAEAMGRGVRQCVILGAGFDTFAYRQPGWAAALRIFEVDHRATQAEKQRRLRRAGVEIPANLEFVTIDFEQVSLQEGLKTSTLDFSKPTFFSCLGVLVYLTADAADAIFELVAGFPSGSEIAFTFASPRATASPLAVRAAQAGEPWRWQIEPHDLERKLTAAGFSSISFLGPLDAERTYFPSPRRDGLTAPTAASIGSAIVG